MSRIERLKNETRPRPISLSMGEGVTKLAEMVNSFLVIHSYLAEQQY